MSGVVPTVEQIEDYLQSLEELLFTSLSAATPDLPNVRDAVQRLWEDVSRFGPQSMPNLPDMHIPGIGPFQVPPPPPPPPPPKSLWSKSADWVVDHPWTCVGIGGLLGAGLLVQYRVLITHRRLKARNLKASGSNSAHRRQVVVVLGGDIANGLPLIVELERKGYIVIASVSTPEAVEEIERNCTGYVKALVLDPAEPDTIPYFLRSLSSALSRRFPITTAGDPYASPSAHPYVFSIISLLTLPSSPPQAAPLEHLPLRSSYLTHLQRTHITPLQLIQALLPLLRSSSVRAQDAFTNNYTRQSIIVCLPATDARVGLPFASAQAMSAAATLRGVEILRREISIAALTDASASMKNIKTVVVDVGAVGVDQNNSRMEAHDAHEAMEAWTPGEKLVYGNAFAASVEGSMQYSVRRRPADVEAFVNTIVDIVGGGRHHGRRISEVGLGLGRIREWIRGDRIVVGAGARTYALASRLPAFILDALLRVPYLIVSIRNSLLPIPPATLPGPSPPATSSTAVVPTKSLMRSHLRDTLEKEQFDHDHDSVAGSDADVESNAGSGVGESWISLADASPERAASPNVA